MEETAKTANNIAEKLSDGYLDNGILGLTVLLFLALFLATFYLLMKKEKNELDTSESLEKLADALQSLVKQNASSADKFESLFTLQQQFIEEERKAVRECYGIIGKNQIRIMQNLGIDHA